MSGFSGSSHDDDEDNEVERLTETVATARSYALSLNAGREELPAWAQIRVDLLVAKLNGLTSEGSKLSCEKHTSSSRSGSQSESHPAPHSYGPSLSECETCGARPCEHFVAMVASLDAQIPKPPPDSSSEAPWKARLTARLDLDGLDPERARRIAIEALCGAGLEVEVLAVEAAPMPSATECRCARWNDVVAAAVTLVDNGNGGEWLTKAVRAMQHEAYGLIPPPARGPSVACVESAARAVNERRIQIGGGGIEAALWNELNESLALRDETKAGPSSRPTDVPEGLLDALVTGEPSAVASEFLATSWEFPTEALAYLIAERDDSERRATIEECAAFIESRAHTGWRSVDVPAALRAQLPATPRADR